MTYSSPLRVRQLNFRNMKNVLLSLGFIFVTIFSTFSQTITPSSNVIYVKKGAIGNGTGSSWTDAVPELADALKWARDNQSEGLWNSDNPLQIWVAKGIYKPLYKHNNEAEAGRPILNSFLMVKDVAIFGGFAGTEASLVNRTDWKANPTILSGELDVPYVEEGNSYTGVCHVVVAAGAVDSAVLDGFTITGGKAMLFDYFDVNGFLTSTSSGGGIYLTASYPTLRNLIVTDNRAAYDGGGIYMESDFSNSTVMSLSGISLTGNTAEHHGGGIYHRTMRVTTHNCALMGNVALRGAAFFSNLTYLSFINTLVAGNHADEMVGTSYSYGAVYLESSNLEITNTTISANKGGSIYTAAGGKVTSIKNSIINNHNYAVPGITESSITNSIVQFQTTNNGSNLAGTTNPRFVNGGSYNNAPFINGDYRLLLNSPVVDKGADASYPGNPAGDTDLAGRPRLAGASVDMGAYEGGYDPLPVTMVSFRAEKEQAQVMLKWVTSMEVNASHFELQRSFDGKVFNAIGVVPAKGESNKTVHYQFSDESSGRAAISYYRIRTVDQDGSFSLSQIISINWDHAEDITARLYPNPAKEETDAGRVSNTLHTTGKPLLLKIQNLTINS
ncbi:hypothetical protein GCM10023091_14180 [Ravibacter arvi]|uniref:Right handed beta helix domain-containing protein n=2 Tax=Ravibacter arvi TaxID=2051041 RepID=A0ABP8LTB9_9BACT